MKISSDGDTYIYDALNRRFIIRTKDNEPLSKEDICHIVYYEKDFQTISSDYLLFRSKSDFITWDKDFMFRHCDTH